MKTMWATVFCAIWAGKKDWYVHLKHISQFLSSLDELAAIFFSY
jgi:hypothetical protein